MNHTNMGGAVFTIFLIISAFTFFRITFLLKKLDFTALKSLPGGGGYSFTNFIFHITYAVLIIIPNKYLNVCAWCISSFSILIFVVVSPVIMHFVSVVLTFILISFSSSSTFLCKLFSHHKNWPYHQHDKTPLITPTPVSSTPIYNILNNTYVICSV